MRCAVGRFRWRPTPTGDVVQWAITILDFLSIEIHLLIMNATLFHVARARFILARRG
jgi:hypothetical protein